jgi:DNA-binding NarL/FixJ family response regulator
MPSLESKINSKTLTQRERSILLLIAEGYENKEIAEELFMSEKKVKENQFHLMRKLRTTTTASIINLALKKGWISLYEVLESRFSKRETGGN